MLDGFIVPMILGGAIGWFESYCVESTQPRSGVRQLTLALVVAINSILVLVTFFASDLGVVQIIMGLVGLVIGIYIEYNGRGRQ